MSLSEDHQAALVALELAKGKLLPPEGSTVRISNAEGKLLSGLLKTARRLNPRSDFVRLVIVDRDGKDNSRIVTATAASSLQLVQLPSPCPPIDQWLHLGGR